MRRSRHFIDLKTVGGGVETSGPRARAMFALGERKRERVEGLLVSPLLPLDMHREVSHQRECSRSYLLPSPLLLSRLPPARLLDCAWGADLAISRGFPSLSARFSIAPAFSPPDMNSDPQPWS